MLAAILHLGDIEFVETAGEHNTDNRATIIDTAPLHRGNFWSIKNSLDNEYNTIQLDILVILRLL